MEEQDLNSWLEDSPVLKHLGIEFVELDPDKVVATMPVDERHHQPLGYLHGGLNLFLAETMGGVGAYLNSPPGKTPFGSEVNGSHLRPRRSGTVTATGTPVHKGNNSQIWEIKIHDEDEKLVSISRCTLTLVDI
ncbi:MAG TPA: hotdog fold thioesterase [Rubrobacteraceae bacterium]|nr:hotdog fold thioesterase [Rubrobacteraceae bacterium]